MTNQDAIEILKEEIDSEKRILWNELYENNPPKETKKFVEAYEMAIKALERSTGHWINYNTPCFSECSECSHPFDWADNCMEDWQYCPNCGAKMEK